VIKASEEGLQFIRDHESFVPRSYPDLNTGKTAIGYGDTLGDKSKPISEDEAERRLRSHVARAETYLSSRITRPLTQAQQNVLIDKYYNLGPHNMEGFISLVNSGSSDDELKQKLLEYNKADNVITGQKEVVPALITRTSDRSRLWSGQTSDQLVPVSPTEQSISSDNSIAEATAQFYDTEITPNIDSSVGVLKTPDMLIDEAAGSFYSEQRPADPVQTRRSGLEFVSGAIDNEEVAYQQKAREVSAKTGIPIEDVDALLSIKTPEQIEADSKHDVISMYMPELYTWLREPNNYALMRDNGDWATQVAATAKPLNPSAWGDIVKSVKSNSLMFEASKVHVGMTLGAIGIKDGKKLLSRIDQERQANQYSLNKDDVKKINDSISALLPAYQKFMAPRTPIEGVGWDGFVEGLKKSYDGTEESLDALMNLFKTVSENKVAATLIASESLGALLPGVAGGVAGAIVGGPVGAAAGFKLGSLAGGSALGYSEYLDKEIEKYRDPQTGIIDYDLAFSDPLEVLKRRKKAAAFGLIVGGADFVTTPLLGKFMVKPVSVVMAAKKGVIKKAGGVVTGLGKEVLIQGVSEAGADFLGRNAADALVGELTRNAVAVNAVESTTEGVFAGVTTLGTAPVAAGIRIGSQIFKRGVDKTVARAEEANKANQAHLNLTELREAKESSKASTDNPQQSQDLVDTVINGGVVEPEGTVTDSLSVAAEVEAVRLEKEANNGIVSVSPKEWDEYFLNKNIDPSVAMSSFGSEKLGEYQANRESNTSVNISIGEWLRFTEGDKKVDGIARVNGNELSGNEGEDLYNAIQKDPFTFFEETAFHGTKHKFDKFEKSGIGTGEGNQAFGHGLYFSEDKGIADYYRRMLTKELDSERGKTVNLYTILEVSRKLEKQLSGNPEVVEAIYENTFSYMENNATLLFDFEEFKSDYTLVNVIAELLYAMWEPRILLTEIKDPTNLEYDSEINLPDEAKKIITDYIEESQIPVIPKNEGQLFEVKINAVKEQMLDWGLPLNEQDPYVQGKLSFLIKQNVSGETFYKSLEKSEGSPDAVSKLLYDLGIKGVKYKAEGGKSNKYNFVVFKDSDIEVSKTFFEETGELPSPIPGVPRKEGDTVSIDSADLIPMITPIEAGDNAISRPVELVSRFRSQDEKQVYNSLLFNLRKFTKGSQVNPESLVIFADLQFRHLQVRAEVLGLPIKDVALRIKVLGAVSPGKGGAFTTGPTAMDPNIIALTKDATVKTLVHEFGHSWLQEMSEDAAYIFSIPEDKLTTSQAEYKAAMVIAAEAFGLNNIQELQLLSLEDATRIQEGFASTSEKYFLEGKFENNKVKALMESFRNWITEFAENILRIKKFQGVEISPEIERMFEAILGVSSKVESEVIPMFTEPLFDAKQLGPDGPKYMGMLADVRSQAIGEAYTKSFNKTLKEREAQIDAQKNQLLEEATREISGLPSMVMSDQFANAYKEFRDAGSTGGDPRISYESFAREFSNGDAAFADELKTRIPQHLITGKKKGGLDVSVVLLQLGISNKQILLDMMLDAGARGNMIQAKLNALIEEKFPIMKSDEEIHQIAVDAVNSNGKEKLLLEEMRILADLHLGTLRKLSARAILPAALIARLSKPAIIEEANLVVENSPSKKFTSNKFLGDSIRHGREASVLFGKGDIIGAFEAKRAEAVSFFAYKNAQEAQKKLAKTRVRMKWFKKSLNNLSALKNKLDVDAIEFGVKLIISVATNQNSIEPMDRDNFSSDHSALPESHIKMINSSIDAFVRQSLGNLGDKINVASSIQFGQILDSIAFAAKKAKEIEVNGKVIQIEVANSLVVQEMSGSTPLTFAAGDNLTGEILRDIADVRTVFGSMFENPLEFNKSMLGYVYNRVVNGEAERSIFMNKNINIIQNAFTKAASKNSILKSILSPLRTIPIIQSFISDLRPIIAPGLNYTFTNQGEEIMAILHMGSDSGARHLVLGNDWGAVNPDTGILDESKWQEFFNSRIASGDITKELMDAIQTIWDAFKEIHPIAKETLRKVDGRNVGYIEGRKVKTPWGDYEGGYVPLRSIKDFVASEGISSILNPDSDNYPSIDLFPNMDTGFANSRSKKYKPVDLNINKIMGILGSVANVAFIKEALTDFGKVLGSEQVSSMLEEKRPLSMENQLAPWFDRIKLQRRTESSGVDSANTVMRHIRKGVTIKLFFLNPNVWGKQFLGFSPAIPFTGKTNMLLAIGQHGASPKQTTEMVMEKSTVMRSELGQGMKNTFKSFEQLDLHWDWLTLTSDKSLGFAVFAIQAFQNAVSVPIWVAAYNYSLDNDSTEAQAIAYADDTVKRTQGSSAISAQSNLKGNGNEIWKAFTAISTIEIAMGNLMHEEAYRDNKARNRATSMIKLAMYVSIFPAIGAWLISQVKLNTSEEEEEKKKDSVKFQEKQNKALAIEMGSTLIGNSIPFYARPLIAPLFFDRAGISPVFDQVKDLSTTVTATKKKAEGVDMTTRQVTALMNTLTIVTGIPLSVIGKGLILDLDYTTSKQEKRQDKRLRQRQIREVKRNNR